MLGRSRFPRFESAQIEGGNFFFALRPPGDDKRKSSQHHRNYVPDRSTSSHVLLQDVKYRLKNTCRSWKCEA